MENYYEEALKLGQKCFKQSLSAGEYPYLPVLDEMALPGGASVGTDVGVIELPIEFVIGTKTRGRTRTFARNFMPIAEDKSEFSSKWKRLCVSHLEEGIRDPVEVYEYMNRFYVQEGNKRVSVLKFFGAVTVAAHVKRILPVRNGDADVERYYEFLHFCEMSGIHYIELSKNGAYQELTAALGMEKDQVWTQEERQDFSSVYYHFEKIYYSCKGDKLRSTVADAMLSYIRLYGYEALKSQSSAQVRKTLTKIWDEIALQQEPSPIDVKLDPEGKTESAEKSKLPIPPLITPLIRKKPMKIAFLYSRGIRESRWNTNHDVGRHHIEEVFGDRIETAAYVMDGSRSIDDNLKGIIADGAKVIFVTESKMVDGCVRVAIEHPEVAILNCSLNKPHRYIRTYYPRMYEAKFITGALAGALTRNGKVGYICKYPIYGMIAEINAFARGVGLVNPEAKIYLEWSSVEGIEAAEERLVKEGIHLISYRDFYDQIAERDVVFGLMDIGFGSSLSPKDIDETASVRTAVLQEKSEVTGISRKDETIVSGKIRPAKSDSLSRLDFPTEPDGMAQERVAGASEMAEGVPAEPVPLALPVWNWGVFYEKIVATILNGSYRDEYKKTSRSLNYYWGMSSGVVDIAFSRKLPQGVRYLGESLCKAIRAGIVHPFYDPQTEKDGQINWETLDQTVSAEDIITMTSLEENVIGTIPSYDELSQEARELVDEIGVESARAEKKVKPEARGEDVRKSIETDSGKSTGKNAGKLIEEESGKFAGKDTGKHVRTKTDDKESKTDGISGGASTQELGKQVDL